METTTTISKAQLKREKDAINSLNNVLNRKLVNFKEMYLKSYVDFMFSKFDESISYWKEMKYSEFNKFGLKNRETEIQFNERMNVNIAEIEKEKAKYYTNILKFINEANDGYVAKFNKMVFECVKYGIQSHPLNIETIGNATTSDFAFLIKSNDVVVHARIIFACGEINAPHYRFIITKRTEK
jgi:hypothetical protein